MADFVCTFLWHRWAYDTWYGLKTRKCTKCSKKQTLLPGGTWNDND